MSGKKEEQKESGGDDIYNDLEEAFRNIDKDNDGFINLRELGTVMRAFNFSLSNNELQDLMKEYDKDASGCLDSSEFSDLMVKKIKEQEEEKDFYETFELFDRNGDGKLTKDELKTLFDSIGEKISDELLDEFIRFTDSHGEGYITRSEFIHFMKEN